MYLRAMVFLFVLVVACPSASAGEYLMQCYFAGSQCAALVSDLVSDRFTSKYPATKWQIVVIGSVSRYSNGGGVGFAVAGVSPIVDDNDLYQSLVPNQRFIVTSRIAEKRLSPYEANAELESLVRDAVRNLMAECDLTPKCDVH